MYSMELGRSPVISSDTSGIWLRMTLLLHHADMTSFVLI